jgi:hypothetical protein
VELRIAGWRKEFLLGRWQSVVVDGQISDKVRVNSGVLQGSILSPPLFLAYVNNIWRKTESNIRLFAGDCVTYKKITDSSDIERLQTDLNR